MKNLDYKNCLWLYHQAERHHPDLMEPYAASVAEAADVEERMKAMRDALFATFRRRYPMPEQFWPTAQRPINPQVSETT